MTKNLLYYDCLNEFNQVFYKDFLTHENLGEDGETKFDNLSDAEGNAADGNIIGYQLNKDGEKYILESKLRFVNDEGVDGFRQLKLSEDLPVVVTRKDKVFSGKSGYNHIIAYEFGKFKPEQKYSFKEFIDLLSGSLSHSNTNHYKMLWMIGITSMISRFNFRLATPPGFGKDSVVEVLGNLIGGARTIENPSYAKLEYLSSLKWLCVNEVVDIKGDNWRNAETFLLTAGALKNQITKATRKYGNVKEILDISNLSLSLFYNDINHYGANKYFDTKAKEAVKDRFVPFRFYGGFVEDFNSINDINVSTFVASNLKTYESLLRTFVYYKLNIDNHYHGYIAPDLKGFSQRWVTNLGKLFKVVDVYCESQEEFNKFTSLFVKSIVDYNAMISYPILLASAVKSKGEKVTDLFVKDHLDCLVTFSEKIKLLDGFIRGNVIDKVGGLNKKW